MSAIAEYPVMAKRRGRPKTSEREDSTVRMNRALIGKAKSIALHRGISVGEFLDEITRVAIDRAYAQMLRELDPPSKDA